MPQLSIQELNELLNRDEDEDEFEEEKDPKQKNIIERKRQFKRFKQEY